MLSNKMNNERADRRPFPGFIKDLERLATRIFPLMNHLHYRFSTLSEKFPWKCSTLPVKLKKIYRLQVLIYCTMQRIQFFLALHSSAASFQMPPEEFCLLKRLATVGIVCATDPLLQNMTRTVYLHYF